MEDLNTEKSEEKVFEENDELRRKLFIAESIIREYSQALSQAQLAQAQLNGQIKYLQQPTE